eukprot:gi/632984360/ref/XP_007909102.1/ PREDICTED: LIM and SH3 domain protein 1 [Callorhinchus milii]
MTEGTVEEQGLYGRVKEAASLEFRGLRGGFLWLWRGREAVSLGMWGSGRPVFLGGGELDSPAFLREALLLEILSEELGIGHLDSSDSIAHALRRKIFVSYRSRLDCDDKIRVLTFLPLVFLFVFQFWHKACFHCEVCKMTLNMKNYKGYDKKPYCNSHYPKQSFTSVADTPENLRLKQQTELQSQVTYKKDFEMNKGRGFSVVADTPEMQRIKKTQDQISNVSAFAPHPPPPPLSLPSLSCPILCL